LSKFFLCALYFSLRFFSSPVSLFLWRNGVLNFWTLTRDLLHEALSGERAKDHVIQITRHHRIQGSRGYRDALSAEYGPVTLSVVSRYFNDLVKVGVMKRKA
jgi:hypothetical protein